MTNNAFKQFLAHYLSLAIIIFYSIVLLTKPTLILEEDIPSKCKTLIYVTLTCIALLFFLRNKNTNTISTAIFILFVVVDTISQNLIFHSTGHINIVTAFVYAPLYALIGLSFTKAHLKLVWIVAILSTLSFLIRSIVTFAGSPELNFNRSDVMIEYQALINLAILIVISFNRYNTFITKKNDMLAISDTQLQTSKRLLTIIGHNIRTPLTTLSLRIGIAKKNGLEEDNFREIEKTVSNLINITESTLMNNGEGRERTSGKELVYDLQKIYHNKIELNVSNSALLHSSPELNKIFLCVQNVIDNAIQWSKKNPQVHLDTKNDRLYILVKDFGKGMSEKDLSSYGSAIGQGLNKQGKGIGIYYSIQLAQSAGFNFHIKTRLHEGTEVLICNDPQEELAFIENSDMLKKSFMNTLHSTGKHHTEAFSVT